jgi:hypothetical protein
MPRIGLIVCALLGMVGCSSSGDGLAVAGKPSPTGAADAGVRAEADGGESTFTVRAGLVPDNGSLICAAELDREDDAGAAVSPLGVALIALNAPFRCQGNNADWSCECDGSSHHSYAVGCVGALLEACGKVAEPLDGPARPPPSDCDSTGLLSREGKCELVAHGEYACHCGAAGMSKTSHARDCETALWQSCGRACQSADGRCEIASDAPIGSYACDCPQNQGTKRDVSAGDCDSALLFACSVVGETEFGCNGYDGFCDDAGDAFACTCLDGSKQRITGVDPQRFSPCQHALDMACGSADTPAGKVCGREGNGYEGRCIQPPDGTAPFTCSCTFHGPTEDEPAFVGPVSATDCESTLLATCPEATPVDAMMRDRACTYYDKCDSDRHPGFDFSACEAAAPDTCVACTNADLDRFPSNTDGCPTDHPTCTEQCSDLVPKTVAIAACDDALDAAGKASAEGKCLCAACWPDFGECMADVGCAEMIDCVQAQGCKQAECEHDPVCGPIITKYQSTHSLALLLRVGQCPAREFCNAP